jgi:glutathione S-transferase
VNPAKLTLYYAPGACSFASHIVLEESAQPYEARRMDLRRGDQRTAEYLKLNPNGRVPCLVLESGEAISENTAILPYLGKRFGLWPKDEMAQVRALSVIGFFASSVHPAFSHVRRPERYCDDPSTHDALRKSGTAAFHGYVHRIDGMLAGRLWLSDQYSVLDPYALLFYSWGLRLELPMRELAHYTAFRDRMVSRAAVQRAVHDEQAVI